MAVAMSVKGMNASQVSNILPPSGWGISHAEFAAVTTPAGWNSLWLSKLPLMGAAPVIKINNMAAGYLDTNALTVDGVLERYTGIKQYSSSMSQFTPYPYLMVDRIKAPKRLKITGTVTLNSSRLLGNDISLLVPKEGSTNDGVIYSLFRQVRPTINTGYYYTYTNNNLTNGQICQSKQLYNWDVNLTCIPAMSEYQKNNCSLRICSFYKWAVTGQYTCDALTWKSLDWIF